MKRKMKPVILTLFILIALTAGGYFLLANKESGPTGEFQKRMEEDQKDLHSDRAYRYDISTRSTVLATSGDGKNVLNFNQKNVYNVANSNAARERLDRLIKRTDATFENPIIALNPFGTNANSLYFYFDTSYRCMVRYTITVEEEAVSDHIRYINNGQENNLSKNHEFVVSGMIPGRKNYIVMELLDTTGAKREEKIYEYAVPGCDLPVRISMQEGHSKETAGTGLYFTFPSGKNVIAAYDNQGVLRNQTVTESGHGTRLCRSIDSILYQVSDTKVVKVSSLGRVTAVVQIKGYGKIKEFSYDGYGEVYSIGTKKGRDYLLASSFETGKTRVVYKFKKKIQVSSLGTPQGGDLCLIAANPPGIIYMDAITSAEPKIANVLGKKSDWKKIINKKKVITDKKAGVWNTTQSVIVPSEENTDRQSMLVEKDGKPTALEWQTDFKGKKANVIFSCETAGGVKGPVQIQGEHYIQSDLSNGNFSEMDKKNKVIRQFSYGAPLDAVIKYALGGMSFYGV